MRPHALVEGPAGSPAVVFSSSLGTTLELWDAQVASLRDECRVVRYDHRGHGGTPVGEEPFGVADLAGDVLELADSLELERFSFVGLSMGGAVGQWLGAYHPERLDRLVVACTSARFGEPERWRDRAALVRAEGVEVVADATLGRWFTPRADPTVVARFGAMLRSTPREGYAACCESLARWDFRAELGRIAVPTLALAGSSDPTSPPSHLEEIASAATDGRVVVLEAAHLAAVERPDEFTRAVRAHLQQTVSA